MSAAFAFIHANRDMLVAGSLIANSIAIVFLGLAVRGRR